MVIYLPIPDEKLEKWARSLNQSRCGSEKYPGEALQVIVHGRGVSSYAAGTDAKGTWTTRPSASPLAGVAGPLFLLAHGLGVSSHFVAGGDRHLGPVPLPKLLSADKLAKRVKKDGLPTAFVDVRLLVCWGGFDRDHGPFHEQPFAGQFCGSMKKEGYANVRVTGYQGKIEMSEGSDQLLVVTSRERGVKVTGDDVQKFLDNPALKNSDPALKYLDFADSAAKVWF